MSLFIYVHKKKKVLIFCLLTLLTSKFNTFRLAKQRFVVLYVHPQDICDVLTSALPRNMTVFHSRTKVEYYPVIFRREKQSVSMGMFDSGQDETCCVAKHTKSGREAMTAGRPYFNRAFELFSATETAVIGLIRKIIFRRHHGILHVKEWREFLLRVEKI